MRALVITIIAAIGLLAGIALDLVFAAATTGPTLPINTIGFGLAGLLVGWLVARLVPRSPRAQARQQQRLERIVGYRRG
jgi:uncharacterized membrane-anchored protein YhcB (DUF1043 family)